MAGTGGNPLFPNGVMFSDADKCVVLELRMETLHRSRFLHRFNILGKPDIKLDENTLTFSLTLSLPDGTEQTYLYKKILPEKIAAFTYKVMDQMVVLTLTKQERGVSGPWLDAAQYLVQEM